MRIVYFHDGERLVRGVQFLRLIVWPLGYLRWRLVGA